MNTYYILGTSQMCENYSTFANLSIGTSWVGVLSTLSPPEGVLPNEFLLNPFWLWWLPIFPAQHSTTCPFERLVPTGTWEYNSAARCFHFESFLTRTLHRWETQVICRRWKRTAAGAKALSVHIIYLWSVLRKTHCTTWDKSCKTGSMQAGKMRNAKF